MYCPTSWYVRHLGDVVATCLGVFGHRCLSAPVGGQALINREVFSRRKCLKVGHGGRTSTFCRSGSRRRHEGTQREQARMEGVGDGPARVHTGARACG